MSVLIGLRLLDFIVEGEVGEEGLPVESQGVKFAGELEQHGIAGAFV